MASCAQCDSFILFGGVSDGTNRYCNEKCHQGHALMRYARQIPAEHVQAELMALHSSLCPKCQGNGPVDIHKVHKVWSLLVLTSWSSTPYLCCRSCATKGQIGGAAFSLVAGWWGFPWGIALTPIQICRNIGGMVSGPKPGEPSAELEKFVRVNLAARMINAGNVPPPLPPPLPPRN